MSSWFPYLQSLQEWVYAHPIIGPIYELIGLFGPCWAFVSVMNAAVNVYFGVLLMPQWWYFTLSAVGCLSFTFILFFFAPALVDPVKTLEKYQRRLQHLSGKIMTPFVLFFKFMDGFGRIWAFFSAFQATVSMIMQSTEWFSSNWWFWMVVSICVAVGSICLANWLLKAIRHSTWGSESGIPNASQLDPDYPETENESTDSTSNNFGPKKLRSPVGSASFNASESNILSFRAYQLVKLNRIFLVPLYFFQFQNGFGRMWAFFALINAFCAIFGVILESYPMNWTTVNEGWYMILALIVASLSGVLTLIQGIASRDKVNDLESSLIPERDGMGVGASYRF